MSSTQSSRPSLQASPVKRSLAGSGAFQTRPSDAETNRKSIGREMRSHWVGFMPVAEFLDVFLPLPVDAKPMPSNRLSFKNMPVNPRVESAMYGPFVDAISSSQLCPSIEFCVTANHGDKSMKGGFKLRPDVGGFCAGNAAISESLWVGSEGGGKSETVEVNDEGDLEDEGEDEEIFCEDDSEDDGQDSEAEGKENDAPRTDRVRQGVTDFRKLELSIEFKRKLAFDGFRKQPSKDLKKFVIDDRPKTRSHTRAQVAAYATQQMARQHRQFAFSVLIAQDYARFIRWDRSAAVVSRRFNYRKSPKIMAQFLWRFEHLTPSQRGRDPTVSYVPEDEIAEVKDVIKHIDPHAVDESYPWIKIMVHDERQRCDRFFLACKPRARVDSLLGRATRGYVAVEVGTQKVVFLKDTWRVNMDGFVKEGVTLQRLNDNSVPHVPTLVCGGDIPGQRTVADFIVQRKPSWLCGNPILRSHTHYRLVLGLVGRPLHTFTSTRNLLQAVYHSLLAHQGAFSKCRILHRDVSADNIMLDLAGNGVLIDWDLAKTVDDLESGARQNERTGTWQFMSTLLLSEPHKSQNLSDDLESHFHVLFYTSLRYSPHNLITELVDIMQIFFDDYRIQQDGTVVGGSGKLAEFINRTQTRKLRWPQCLPLTFWIEDTMDAVTELLNHHRIVHTAQKRAELTGESYSEPDGSHLRLSSHDYLIKLCEDAICKDGWPDDDNAGDQLGMASRKSKAVGKSKKRGSSSLDETSDVLLRRSTRPKISNS